MEARLVAGIVAVAMVLGTISPMVTASSESGSVTQGPLATVGANAFSYIDMSAYSTGNKLNGPMVMNFYSYARVCPNATQKDPIARIDVPFTISNSQFNSIKDPWNTTGLDKDGRHFYSWNLKGTSLSSCGYFYVYGNAKVDPGFNLTRSVTPWTLKKTHTLVT